MSAIVWNALGLLGLAIFAVVAFAALKPDTFEVKREAVIGAPAERIFAVINDFAQWPRWSPWQDIDPGMRQTFKGPSSGVGAIAEWEGNKMVGAGRTEIVDVLPPTRIGMRLTMLRPMKAVNEVEYTLRPQGDGTLVTWAMRGNNNLMGKIFATFVDCDKMVGKDFERGLANLKRLVEGQANPLARAN